MLDQRQRAAILELHRCGHSVRAIADTLDVARATVDSVIASGTDEVPTVVRPEVADPWREAILELYPDCKGNLIRVHEELIKRGATLSYQALTGYCRRHGIGHEPKLPAGNYDFKPGEEMQHDTSPHKAMIGGVMKNVQTASLVLCFSRMIFIQLFASFTRFECKLFLTAALKYFGGAAARCMIDNTHVIVLRGSGATMVPVPEMAAFSERLGFTFAAHEKGDANRSARVEGPFDFVDNNFLARPGSFDDWAHLNREALAWCDKVNAARSAKLHATRRELFAVERTALKPLPIWVPDVYVLHHRIVDLEGYVTVRHNRYSVPYALIGKRTEVRELAERIEIYDGPRLVAEHPRVLEPLGGRTTNPTHRPPRGEGAKRMPPPEEAQLLAAQPKLASYLAALKQHASGRGTLACRRLLKMVHDYPEAPLLAAIERAEHYGLFDLDRLERLVLRQVAADYFTLPTAEDQPETHDE